MFEFFSDDLDLHCGPRQFPQCHAAVGRWRLVFKGKAIGVEGRGEESLTLTSFGVKL